MQASTRAIPRHYETFDTFINLKPLGKTVDFEWNFNTDLFQKETIQLRLNEFKQFLQGILVDVEKPIPELHLLPDFEMNQIHAFGQGDQVSFPLHQCLHELFAEQANRTPKKVAAKMTTGEQLTYEELNEKSDALARVFIKKNVQTGDFIGLCLERSMDMLVGIYGILKAGAAYVPIDPRNPKERIEFMLKDAGCQVVVTQEGMEGGLSFFEGEVVNTACTYDVNGPDLNRGDKERRGNSPIAQNPKTPKPNSHSPAYVIYTSGSTGTPKGVVVRHENAVNTLFAINRHLHISEESTVYSVSSMSFDMSIPDYFLTLVKGATLILADEETKKDGFDLRTSIENYRPTLMQATPTTWQILIAVRLAG